MSVFWVVVIAQLVGVFVMGSLMYVTRPRRQALIKSGGDFAMVLAVVALWELLLLAAIIVAIANRRREKLYHEKLW